jgi:transposase
MLSFAPSTKVFLYLPPTDMRKSFDSLAALVRDQLRHDPLSGHFFVFRSKRQDRLKLLYWDCDGFILWMKRLERGSFQFPEVLDAEAGLEITATDFALILRGIDLKAQRQKQYQRPVSSHTDESNP